MANTSWSNLILPLVQSTASQWVIIFSLIFGGCCSNAWALELTTRHNPHSGTLITFAQYLIVVITNLPKHFIYEPMMRDRPTRKQVLEYIVQHVQEIQKREKRVTAAGEDPRVVVEGDTPDERAMWARELEERLQKTGTKQVGASGSVVVVHDELHNAASSDGKTILKVVLSNDMPPATPVPTVCISPNNPDRPQILSTQSLTSTIPLPTPTLWTQLPKIYLRQRKIPIKIWMIQVLLFFAVSLLNNLALGFDVNLAVHIIFRSGGLAANLLMGWLMKGKRYSRAQVVSVVLVTIGVASATLSTKMEKGKGGGGDGDYHTNAGGGGSFSGSSYAIGIALLTIALLLSAAMGLAQEDAYAAYGRHWEEGLFYLHFLGMPMFAFFGRDLLSQFQIANASPPVEISAVSLLRSSQPAVQDFFYIPATPITPQPYPHYVYKYLEKAITWADAVIPAFTIPSFWIPLGMNVLTQLVCVSGVHRLTSRVSSLTVTLILVIRKAVSLGISVLLIQGHKGNVWLWGGAAAVLMGTVMYSVDGARAKKRSRGVAAAVEGSSDSKKRR
ncbi:golgi uridine diphosphate-N- acetylglucosamine transporter [Tulasnella sp. 424]|nr:golgi uridine diphosphate-N- acetylglucosamine transporter [Tulasnella sp. 424]KAG8973760.1 golgi uridine diphosphate-N- acetylglucosamine transporter [Tulasnella sp. 425]